MISADWVVALARICAISVYLVGNLAGNPTGQNAYSQPMKVERWRIVTVGVESADSWMDQGWEPFAVTIDTRQGVNRMFYLRRKVTP